MSKELKLWQEQKQAAKLLPKPIKPNMVAIFIQKSVLKAVRLDELVGSSLTVS